MGIVIDLSKYPKAWCSICEAIKPIRFDEMQAGGLNDHDAADVLCNECDFVIATFHAEPTA